MNPFKTDITDQPVAIIPTKDGGYRFYPRNIEAITGFLDFERDKLKEKELEYCGAV